MHSPVSSRSSAIGSYILSTRLIFLICGIAMATWAALVPFAKARLDIDDAELGVLLLCLGLGSLVAMPAAGLLVRRFSLRTTLLGSGILLCGSLACLAFAPTVAAMMVAILAFGAAIGCTDVAMNLQAVLVERQAGRPIMSGFHGLYSLGGLVGAAVASGLFSLGLSHVASVLVVVAGQAAMLAVAVPRFLATGGEGEQGPFFVRPHGIVVLIGVLCLISFLAEGAMVDWSALFLTSERGVDAAQAGFGYAVFSITMTGGRLTGDRLVRRFGPETVLILGGLAAAGGFLLAVLGPTAFTALAGFAFVGAGASNIVPVLFSAAGRQSAMPPGLAIAAVSALGYAGVLIGPGFLGFIASLSSLSVSLGCLTALLLAVPLAAPAILRRGA